jgi:hypothetical protein
MKSAEQRHDEGPRDSSYKATGGNEILLTQEYQLEVVDEQSLNIFSISRGTAGSPLPIQLKPAKNPTGQIKTGLSGRQSMNVVFAKLDRIMPFTSKAPGLQTTKNNVTVSSRNLNPAKTTIAVPQNSSKVKGVGQSLILGKARHSIF